MLSIVVGPSGIVTLDRLVQSWKTPPYIVLILDDSLTLVKLEQNLKALLPNEVTLLGIVILLRLLHPLNASDPIDVTPLGIVMLDNIEQLLKALSPIVLTLSGTVTLIRLLHP